MTTISPERQEQMQSARYGSRRACQSCGREFRHKQPAVRLCPLCFSEMRAISNKQLIQTQSGYRPWKEQPT